MSTSPDTPKLRHFYNFCFVVQEVGLSKFIASPIQLETSELTMPVLAGVRRSMNVPEHAVLLSASYLCYTTLEKFSPPVRGGMDATSEYLAGIQAGINNTEEQNPFEVGTVKYLDWRNGRLKGEEMYLAAHPVPEE